MSSSQGQKAQHRPNTLDLAARDLTMAAQASSSRPGSMVDQPRRGAGSPQSPPNRGPRPSNKSPFNDPKFAQGCDATGRRPSGVRRGLPEEFYRTKSPSPAGTSSGRQTPVNRPQQPSAAVQRWLDANPRESTIESDDIGLPTYDIQAKRLTMARLWAAKTLIEQAYEHEDLDPGVEESKRPLYPYGNQMENIMFQLTDVVQHLGNDKLARDYEEAYTIPKESRYYGKGFGKLVPADARKMLAAAEGVVDRIVGEIR